MSYQFTIKGQQAVCVLELVKHPNEINHTLASEVLEESFITEYEKYLKPEQVRDDLTTWRDGEKSVKQFYTDYFKTELTDFVNGKIDYWVEAKINGKLVGWATFMREKNDANSVYMNLLAVHPDYNKKGIGGQLVNSLFNMNIIPELNAINLLLRKRNEGGRIFYGKLGFQLNPTYTREDNFVEADLLEGLSWKNPALQNKQRKSHHSH